jgi:hypothetical protein
VHLIAIHLTGVDLFSSVYIVKGLRRQVRERKRGSVAKDEQQ